ncbi:alpha/beta hydrolase [Aestuariicella hydrocarbonica]|uniref:Alpha/beta hydrolase n=1 Tax=Pseudomaricurvus hydrocarbonicus TaxID=1470433 RepID=A0A9E5MHD6_9GAMM|nr:alpha/beta hydrolase [Aestuariicella hydrocarbonica]NHO65811.1 alpha/beta hydrolase [Aestuariicella hydrocarbonica]
MTVESSIFKDNLFAGLSGRQGVVTGPYEVATPLVIAVHGGTYSSAYFDVPGYSLFDKAKQLNIPILALDRPGYGFSKPLPIDRATIEGQAAYLGPLLQAAWEEYGAGTCGIVLIGHSIGAAIATVIAAENRQSPLLGLAVSGVGMRTPEHFRDAWDSLPDTYMVDMPKAIKDDVMFGPEGSFGDDMPNVTYPAYTEAPKVELVDIVGTWSDKVSDVLAKVRVPVHYRQGEMDKLWIVSPAEVNDFARSLTWASRVDAAMVEQTGHCMDYHLIASSFQIQQLGFAMQCAQEAWWRQ